MRRRKNRLLFGAIASVGVLSILGVISFSNHVGPIEPDLSFATGSGWRYVRTEDGEWQSERRDSELPFAEFAVRVENEANRTGFVRTFASKGVGYRYEDNRYDREILVEDQDGHAALFYLEKMNSPSAYVRSFVRWCSRG